MSLSNSNGTGDSPKTQPPHLPSLATLEAELPLEQLLDMRIELDMSAELSGSTGYRVHAVPVAIFPADDDEDVDEAVAGDDRCDSTQALFDELARSTGRTVSCAGFVELACPSRRAPIAGTGADTYVNVIEPNHDVSVFRLHCTCVSCLPFREYVMQVFLRDYDGTKLWTRFEAKLQPFYAMISNVQEAVQDGSPYGPDDNIAADMELIYQHSEDIRDALWRTNGRWENSSLVEDVQFIIDFSSLYRRDPHQLLNLLAQQQRSISIEYGALMKQSLALSLTPSTPFDPDSLCQLDELLHYIMDSYENLCGAITMLSPLMFELQRGHMHQFSLTWAMLTKRIYQRYVYDTIKPELVECVLKLGVALDPSTFQRLVYRFMRYDDDMTLVTYKWREIWSNLNVFGASPGERVRRKRLSMHQALLTAVKMTTHPLELADGDATLDGDAWDECMGGVDRQRAWTQTVHWLRTRWPGETLEAPTLGPLVLVRCRKCGQAPAVHAVDCECRTCDVGGSPAVPGLDVSQQLCVRCTPFAPVARKYLATLSDIVQLYESDVKLVAPPHSHELVDELNAFVLGNMSLNRDEYNLMVNKMLSDRKRMPDKQSQLNYSVLKKAGKTLAQQAKLTRKDDMLAAVYEPQMLGRYAHRATSDQQRAKIERARDVGLAVRPVLIGDPAMVQAQQETIKSMFDVALKVLEREADELTRPLQPRELRERLPEWDEWLLNSGYHVSWAVFPYLTGRVPYSAPRVDVKYFCMGMSPCDSDLCRLAMQLIGCQFPVRFARFLTRAVDSGCSTCGDGYSMPLMQRAFIAYATLTEFPDDARTFLVQVLAEYYASSTYMTTSLRLNVKVPSSALYYELLNDCFTLVPGTDIRLNEQWMCDQYDRFVDPVSDASFWHYTNACGYDAETMQMYRIVDTAPTTLSGKKCARLKRLDVALQTLRQLAASVDRSTVNGRLSQFLLDTVQLVAEREFGERVLKPIGSYRDERWLWGEWHHHRYHLAWAVFPYLKGRRRYTSPHLYASHMCMMKKPACTRPECQLAKQILLGQVPMRYASFLCMAYEAPPDDETLYRLKIAFLFYIGFTEVPAGEMGFFLELMTQYAAQDSVRSSVNALFTTKTGEQPALTSEHLSSCLRLSACVDVEPNTDWLLNKYVPNRLDDRFDTAVRRTEFIFRHFPGKARRRAMAAAGDCATNGPAVPTKPDVAHETRKGCCVYNEQKLCGCSKCREFGDMWLNFRTIHATTTRDRLRQRLRTKAAARAAQEWTGPETLDVESPASPSPPSTLSNSPRSLTPTLDEDCLVGDDVDINLVLAELNANAIALAHEMTAGDGTAAKSAHAATLKATGARKTAPLAAGPSPALEAKALRFKRMLAKKVALARSKQCASRLTANEPDFAPYCSHHHPNDGPAAPAAAVAAAPATKAAPAAAATATKAAAPAAPAAKSATSVKTQTKATAAWPVSTPVAADAKSTSAAAPTAAAAAPPAKTSTAGWPDVPKEPAQKQIGHWAIPDIVDFIEGHSSGPPKKNAELTKKAAKKAKQKMKKQMDGKIEALQEKRDEFLSVYCRESSAKDELKTLKQTECSSSGMPAGKKRDLKKRIADTDSQVRKLSKLRATHEQIILELIAELKSIDADFKFTYLPTKEQVLAMKTQPPKDVPKAHKPKADASTAPVAPASPSQSAAVDADGSPKRMVTIQRINMSETNPEVRVVAKGDSPDSDRLLYTFVNGQIIESTPSARINDEMLSIDLAHVYQTQLEEMRQMNENRYARTAMAEADRGTTEARHKTRPAADEPPSKAKKKADKKARKAEAAATRRDQQKSQPGDEDETSSVDTAPSTTADDKRIERLTERTKNLRIGDDRKKTTKAPKVEKAAKPKASKAPKTSYADPDYRSNKFGVLMATDDEDNYSSETDSQSSSSDVGERKPRATTEYDTLSLFDQPREVAFTTVKKVDKPKPKPVSPVAEPVSRRGGRSKRGSAAAAAAAPAPPVAASPVASRRAGGGRATGRQTIALSELPSYLRPLATPQPIEIQRSSRRRRKRQPPAGPQPVEPAPPVAAPPVPAPLPVPTMSSLLRPTETMAQKLKNSMQRLSINDDTTIELVREHANARQQAQLAPGAPAGLSIIDQLQSGIQMDGLMLPPGITLTRVDPAQAEQIRAKKESIQKICQPMQTHIETMPAPPPHVIMPTGHLQTRTGDPNGAIIMVETGKLKASNGPTARAAQPAMPVLSEPRGSRSRRRRGKKRDQGPSPTLLAQVQQQQQQRLQQQSAPIAVAPLAGIQASITQDPNTRVVTLRNPMFNKPATAAGVGGPAVSAVPVAGAALPAAAIDTPASIIKNPNGMFTIRNPAMHQALQQTFPASLIKQAPVAAGSGEPPADAPPALPAYMQPVPADAPADAFAPAVGAPAHRLMPQLESFSFFSDHNIIDPRPPVQPIRPPSLVIGSERKNGACLQPPSASAASAFGRDDMFNHLSTLNTPFARTAEPPPFQHFGMDYVTAPIKAPPPGLTPKPGNGVFGAANGEPLLNGHSTHNGLFHTHNGRSQSTSPTARLAGVPPGIAPKPYFMHQPPPPLPDVMPVKRDSRIAANFDFLHTLKPGQRLNSEVTIHNVSESKFHRQNNAHGNCGAGSANAVEITRVPLANAPSTSVFGAAGFLGSEFSDNGIFAPNAQLSLNDLEGEEREIESFKRFNFDFKPPVNKPKVNFDLKDFMNRTTPNATGSVPVSAGMAFLPHGPEPLLASAPKSDSPSDSGSSSAYYSETASLNGVNGALATESTGDAATLDDLYNDLSLLQLGAELGVKVEELGMLTGNLNGANAAKAMELGLALGLSAAGVPNLGRLDMAGACASVLDGASPQLGATDAASAAAAAAFNGAVGGNGDRSHLDRFARGGRMDKGALVD